MRRLLAAGALGGVVAVLLAGCGLPEGVDGDLTDDWGEFPEPVAFIPAASVCHAAPPVESAALVDYRPIDCALPHLVETVHVGEFTGDAAERETPPSPGSRALREAHAECEERVADFLGADYRYGRLTMVVATPTEAGWSGGSRWFRCDLSEMRDMRGNLAERVGSLRGALAEDSDSGLRLGCITTEQDDEGNLGERVQVPCDQPHEAEFVGVWRSPDDEYPAPADEEARRRVYQGCREEIAEYVGVPNDGNLTYRTGVIADWMSEDAWDNGDRTFRCYLYLPERELTESLRGAGTEGLPIHIE